MDFSWLIFIVVIVINSVVVGIMYLSQFANKKLPPRQSIVPGTKQIFLHMFDFYTSGWGDLIALPLSANAFAHLVVNGHIVSWQWLLFTTIMLIDAFAFAKMCLRENHKPDCGYPEIGKISLNGIIHLPYHGAMVAINIFVVGYTIKGDIEGLILYICILGWLLYLIAFALDIKSGNFKSLKRE